MEWPTGGQMVPVPVILNSSRPGRHRGRLNSEHPQNRPVYYQDQFGLLIPADGGGGGRHGRSSSVSGPHGAQPAVIVNNEIWQEQSPSPRHRRRSSHGHDYHYSDDDDWEEHRHDRRRRGYSRGSRTPSPLYDSETEERLRKLKLLEKKEEDQAAQERWEEEQIIKAARKEKKKKEEEELKKRAVEEYELKKLEDAAKAKKKKEEEEEAFREKAMVTFAAAGYSKKSVAGILEAAERGKKVKHGNQIMDLSRPTYIKVNKKHLSPETLNEYELPWKWDEVSCPPVSSFFHFTSLFPTTAGSDELMNRQRDSNFIIIKRWIPERDQDILFEHTRKLRERKLLTDTTVALKKEKDQLMLVRKRSPSRAKSKSRPTSWFGS